MNCLSAIHGIGRFVTLDFFNFFPASLSNILIGILRRARERGRKATLVRRARQFLESTRGNDLADLYLSWVGYCPIARINEIFGAEESPVFYKKLKAIFTEYSNDPIKAASIVDFLSFVPFNLLQAADRTSMSHSLELRSPFVGKDLVVDILSVTSTAKQPRFRGVKKPVLVEAFQSILPAFILRKPKRAFNPPMQDMLYKQLASLSELLLCDTNGQLLKIVGKEFLFDQLEAFKMGTKDNSTYLWGLGVLEWWLRFGAQGSGASKQ